MSAWQRGALHACLLAAFRAFDDVLLERRERQIQVGDVARMAELYFIQFQFFSGPAGGCERDGEHRCGHHGAIFHRIHPFVLRFLFIGIVGLPLSSTQADECPVNGK